MSGPETFTGLEAMQALFVQTAHAAEQVDDRIVLRGGPGDARY